MSRTTLTTRLRAVVADGPLVARRRARTDVGLLMLSGALVAVLVLAALLAPRLVAEVADRGARHAVTQGRPASDLDAQVLVATSPVPGVRLPGVVEDLRADAAVVAQSLPPLVADVLGEPRVTTTTNAWLARTDAGPLAARIGHVLATPGGPAPVQWVEGREPRRLPDVEPAEDQPLASLERDVEVGISRAAAEQVGLRLGSEVAVQGPMVSRLTARVVGLYDVTDPDDDVWTGMAEFVGPEPAAPGSSADAAVGFLASDASLADVLVAMQATGATTHFRFAAQPDHLSATDNAPLAREIRALRADPAPLRLTDGRVPMPVTTLDQVLLAYEARIAGAAAQASVLLLGLATVGALTLVLAARLLVLRRTGGLVLERARGSSVAGVVWRSVLESVPLVAVATLVAAGVLLLVLPGSHGTWWPAGALAAVGAAAPGALAAGVARSSWTGRRGTANRAARDLIAARRRTRRLVTELTLVALAVAALVSVRTRGLLPGDAGSVDWLLAATPVLLAAAATVLVSYALPPVVRRLRAVAARGRSVAGLVAAARAEHASRTAVPLLTMTIAVALVVFCGTTIATVDVGQERAAQAVVGADARLDGPVDDATLTALAAAPGVDSVVGSREWLARTFGRSSGVDVTLLALDVRAFAQRETTEGRTPDPGLVALAEAGADGAVPALISPGLATTADTFGPQVWVTDAFVGLDVQGATTLGSGPTVVVDRERLADALAVPVPAERTSLDGPGADAAARSVTTLPGVTVLTRAQWLEDWQSSPLVTGLRSLLVVAQVTLALLAAVALTLTVVATSRDRRRTLHVLRTQGLPARDSRRLAAGEVLPLVVAALVGGVLIGLAVPWLLTGSLGLSELTGEPDGTRVALAWEPFVLVVGTVLLGLLVAVEAEARARRDDDLAQGIREAER